ncbi:MAG: radical SAM protein, partial [Candidatus Aminicenantales bacterium]
MDALDREGAVTVFDFSPGPRAVMLDFSAREMPHATLEINRTCNMRCRCCYNIDRSWVKSFEEIERDLDRAMALRRLQAVTILGGEPTLHPDLPRIVALVKSRGLHCQLLTNGLRFLDVDGLKLVRAVKGAGVDKILLHVDSGQAHVHGDIEAARKKLFSLMEAERIEFGLSVTVYNEDRGLL